MAELLKEKRILLAIKDQILTDKLPSCTLSVQVFEIIEKERDGVTICRVADGRNLILAQFVNAGKELAVGDLLDLDDFLFRLSFNSSQNYTAFLEVQSFSVLQCLPSQQLGVPVDLFVDPEFTDFCNKHPFSKSMLKDGDMVFDDGDLPYGPPCPVSDENEDTSNSLQGSTINTSGHATKEPMFDSQPLSIVSVPFISEDSATSDDSPSSSPCEDSLIIDFPVIDSPLNRKRPAPISQATDAIQNQKSTSSKEGGQVMSSSEDDDVIMVSTTRIKKKNNTKKNKASDTPSEIRPISVPKKNKKSQQTEPREYLIICTTDEGTQKEQVVTEGVIDMAENISSFVFAPTFLCDTIRVGLSVSSNANITVSDDQTQFHFQPIQRDKAVSVTFIEIEAPNSYSLVPTTITSRFIIPVMKRGAPPDTTPFHISPVKPKFLGKRPRGEPLDVILPLPKPKKVDDSSSSSSSSSSSDPVASPAASPARSNSAPSPSPKSKPKPKSNPGPLWATTLEPKATPSPARFEYFGWLEVGLSKKKQKTTE